MSRFATGGSGHCAQEEEATQQRKRELLAAQQAKARRACCRATCAVHVACCMSHVLATVCPVRECYSWNVCTGCLQRAIETQQREAQRQQLRALMAQKAEEEAAKRRRAEADARAVEAQAEVKRQAELEEAKRHAAAAAVRWQTRAAHCARHVACCSSVARCTPHMLHAALAGPTSSWRSWSHEAPPRGVPHGGGCLMCFAGWNYLNATECVRVTVSLCVPVSMLVD